MQSKDQKYKTIYSLRVRMALRDKGIEPLAENESPYDSRFKCWLYSCTPEFWIAFNEVTGGRKNG